MKSIRIQGALLWSGLKDQPDIYNAVILIEGTKITYAGEAANAPESPGATVIAADGKLCMPALWNAHTHLAMTLLRGVGSDLALDDWLNNAIFPREDKMDARHIIAGTNLALLEMARTGTVGCADMYNNMNEVAKCVLASGHKASLARGVVSFGGIKERLAESIELFRKYDGADERIKVMMSPHAEYTNTPETLAAIARVAEALGTGAHVHISETAQEHAGCLQRHGVTPTQLMHDIGLLSLPRPSLLAHAVHASSADHQIIAQSNAHVGHCPISNLKLACGTLPLPGLLSVGGKAGLGTDGAASNNTLNMFEELRMVALVHKGQTGDPAAISAAHAVSLATKASAAACGFPESGEIKPGAPADLLLLDLNVPHAVPLIDAATHIAYAAQGSDVVLTVCDGRILYNNCEYKTLDADRVLAQAREMSATLEMHA